jgi:tRNA-dihydrouridine synthase B
MYNLIRKPLVIGHLELPHRLIQGPLAGYSCAAMRLMFADFVNPAYAVSEMLSAHDVLTKHEINSRYLYRSPGEGKLCYQLAGSDPLEIVEAAIKLVEIGADLIDINCGCPMPKIRKKGAGSALLEKPEALFHLVKTLKDAVNIPLSIKIRIQDAAKDAYLAQGIEANGADVLIVHGRRHIDDYDISCNYAAIRAIKSSLSIPVIANGDVACAQSLVTAMHLSGADGLMISRAGCGKPWIYEDLLSGKQREPSYLLQIRLLEKHMRFLAQLEGEFGACLQGRSLLRYYLRPFLDKLNLAQLYQACDFADFFKILQA